MWDLQLMLTYNFPFSKNNLPQKNHHKNLLFLSKKLISNRDQSINSVIHRYNLRFIVQVNQHGANDSLGGANHQSSGSIQVVHPSRNWFESRWRNYCTQFHIKTQITQLKSPLNSIPFHSITRCSSLVKLIKSHINFLHLLRD